MELKENGADNNGDFKETALLKNESKYKETPSGCCRSIHTRNCCIATGVFGCIFLILGVVVMLAGGPMLEKKILKSMALSEGSDRFQTWLEPWRMDLDPALTAYAFNITNKDEVLRGGKPKLEEVGPFVYKSKTIKDSDDNIRFYKDDTLTYRPRKIYTFDPVASGNKNPDTTFITVPNIPFWTGMNKARKLGGFGRNTARDIVLNNGLGVPFIDVSFSGLLWGYEDELPCLKYDMPKGCDKDAGDDEDDGWGDDDSDPWGDEEESDPWGDEEEESDPFGDEEESVDENVLDDDSVDKLIEPPKDSMWEMLKKPKAEFVGCKCNWGLFRDRNVTMRKPIRIFSGVSDLKMKGVVKKYDGKTTLGWWKKDSMCDKVKGQDSSTLPPSLNKDMTLEIYIALMCRTINLKYEKDVNHAGVDTLRFIPPENALGSHDDPNPDVKNPDNECYCLKDEGFRCFKSGVTYMEPCKRELMAPLALSMPHFYQADQSFRDAIDGMKPEKEKHEFFMDVVPEFGFPLAIRPRFQLNVVISGMPDVPSITKIPNDLVLPFLWAQDGFDEPSEKMAKAIKFGVAAPEKLPLLGSVVFFVIGAILLLICLAYFFWVRRSASHTIRDAL